MVKATYDEKGNLASIEAARVRIEYPDGRVEEYNDCSANMSNGPWGVFELPLAKIGGALGKAIIKLLDDKGDVLLTLDSLRLMGTSILMEVEGAAPPPFEPSYVTGRLVET